MSCTDKESVRQMTLAWVRVQPTIFAYIRSVVNNHHDAEDILQRVAMTVVEKYDRYDPTRPFGAWAIGLARIELMRFRSHAVRDRLVFQDKAFERITSACEKQVDQTDARCDALRSCIERLQGKARTVLELHYIRALKPDAVAEQMGMTPNAVFVTLHRVRLALKRCMESAMTRDAV